MKNNSDYKKQNEKYILEELEARQLFSGGLEGIIVNQIESPVATYIDIDSTNDTTSTEQQQDAPSTADLISQEIVFVDTGVDNYQALIDDLHNNADDNRNLEVILLNENQNGIDIITQTLQDREDLDAIHIISHGDDGSVQLGNTTLDADTLADNNLAIALWANAFDEGGDILIYGCNLAETELGQDLVNALSELTLADVAASTDTTGHESLGGDWDLEYHAGEIEAGVAQSAGVQASYQHILAVINGTTGNDTLNGTAGDDVISGDAGNDVLVSGGGNDQMLGEADDDIFRFTGAQNGDVITVDGGTGTDTIDLSGYNIADAVFADGRVTIDTGTGFSFEINYSNIDSIQFADTTATVLTGNTGATGFSGSATYIEGDAAFTIDLSGGGTIDWSYVAATNSLTISDTDGTSGSSAITITSHDGSNFSFDGITSDGHVGSLTTNVDIAQITFMANSDDNTIDNITVNNGAGTINSITYLGDSGLVGPTTTIDANVGTFTMAADVDSGTFLITGDLRTLDVSNFAGGTIIAERVIGQFDSIADGAYSNNFATPTKVTLDGSVTTEAAPNVAPTITSNGGGATASINVTENNTAVTTVTASDADLDTFTYSIDPASDDDGFFSIDAGGVLSFIAAPDFETPADLNGDNVYEVTIKVDDGNGGVDTQAISVTVTDSAETYMVSNTADSGAGSLRQAILDANANTGVTDTITFNIAGAGPHIINLTSALPTISDPININGSSEPDYSGDPVVRIDGTSAGAGNGLTFANGSDSSSVSGLMITNFTGNGIQINSGADGISITGNWIGTTGTGTTGDGNSNNGINVQGVNTIIGGTGANEGNVITNNGNEGINLQSGATGTVIQGNIIGLDPDGATGSGNTDVGIAVLSGAHNTTIGGTDPNAGNIISMNYEGIEINSNNNTIQGNYIGTDITGTLDRGNRSDDGIEIQNNATGNLIGGTDPGAGNIIAFNALDGVNIVSGSNNTLLGNQIHSNGDLDVDLAAGANSDQSAPSLSSGLTNGSQVHITGSLSSSANSFYRVEFFGANQTYLGFANVATDGSGNASIDTVLAVNVAGGETITSTATKSEATYSSFTETSEISASVNAVTFDITSNLEMHLNLDDAAGPTANDTTANNNDGTLNGSATWTTGEIDGGLQVDYTDGTDYVQVPNSSSLENVQEGNYTLASWFNPGSTPPGSGAAADANYGILIKPGMHSGLYYGNDNRFHLDHQLADGSTVSSTSTNTFAPGQFYHVVGIVDRDAGIVSLYVDGQLEDTTSFTPGDNAREYGTANWNLGAAFGGGGDWSWGADGTIDDARIYSRALTGDDAAELFALAPTVASDTTSFQEGVSGYTGTQDTYLRAGSADTSFGTVNGIQVDLDGGGGGGPTTKQALLQFDNIFGNGAGQIPPGSTINSATLTLNVTDASAVGAQIGLHRMLTAWSESSTWNSMTGGISTDDIEAKSAADAMISSPAATGQIVINGLASALQAWSDGDTNYGWAIISNSTNGWDFDSSEAVTASSRPQLVVDYTAPAVNSAPVLADANDLTAINEDDVTNSGTLVSTLISGQITDADASSLEGIAVIAVDDTNGSWEYTTDSGSNWTAFGAVDDSTARLLAADADTSVRFVPDPDWNGTVTDGITFHAWDQTSGTAGGTEDLAGTATVRDEFTSGNGFSGDDGTVSWSGDWQQIGETDGANAGTVTADGTPEALAIGGDSSVNITGDGVQRQVDLSAATSATLTLDVWRSTDTDNSEVSLQVSADGSNWFELQEFDMTNTPDSATGYSYDISAYASATTWIRFEGLGTTDAGETNYLYFDNVQIAYQGAANTGGNTAFSSNSASSSISVNSVPINNLPAAQSTAEDTAITFNSANGNPISISGNTGDNLAVTLSVTNGTLTLSQTTGLTFDAGANGSATMTLTGTVEDINASLDGLQYTPSLNYTGADTLTLVSTETQTYVLDTDANLSGYYSFEGGNANDQSPAGVNDATLVGNATITTDVDRGEVLNLDGIGDGAQITGLFGNPTDVTLAAWVNLTAADTGGAELISLGDNVSIRLDKVVDGNGVEGYFFQGSDWERTPSSQYIAGTGWHHIAYTFDDTANVQRLYIDGVVVATSNHTQSINYGRGSDTFIGTHGNGGADYDTNGLIDDARVFTRALSTTEVATLAAEQTSDSDSVAITVTPVNDAPTDIVVGSTITGGLNLNDDGGNDTYLVADSGLTAPLTQFTFETQFVGNNASSEVPFISYNTGSGDILTINTMANNTLELDIGTGTEVFSSAIDYNAALMDGQPHTLSVSWDNTAGDWAVYIDGALIDSGTGLSVGETIPTGGTLMFGLEQDSTGGGFESQEFFNGTFYDIRLFDDVRTSTEVVNNYDQTLANTEPGMLANWVFDNFSGNGVITETVSGNNLTEQHFVGAGFTSSSPNLTLSIPENASNGTAVGTVSAVDPDAGDTFTYILTDDANGRFDINPSSGEITLIDDSQIDFEAATSHDITVRVSDSGGLTFDKVFTIDVTNVNETPVAVADSITAIEGVPYVAQLTVDDLLLNDSDPDGDTLTVNTTPVSGPTNGSLVLNADGTFTYTPNTDFNGTDAFTYQVLDGNGGTAQATVNITVQPREVRILFSTASDVNNSKVPGVASWDAGDILGIGDPNLSFEPAGSDGSVLPYMDLEAFAASNNMSINGLHFVSNDITVGGANSVDLQRGDLLFVSANNETMTSNNTLAINAGDVIIFRPTAVDDYSSGTFIHLLDQPGTAMTTGITLIEKDVTIGDVTLSAGGFLFTQQSFVEESSIYYHPADDVGAGTTSGTVQTLISSVDMDVNWNNFVGVMIINEDLYLDGTMVPAGSIVTTLAGGDSYVGANGIQVDEDQIIYLTVTSTTMGSGTTVADATLLFDGGDIGLNNSSKKMNNLTIIEEITPVNTDPVITPTASALSYTEQNPPTVIDSAATLVDPDSANFDTGVLRVELTVGGTANDRLAINHQGTGAGQVGVSGNTVSYGGITIGTFSGGGSGSEPLVIVLNADATVAAVEALMRNITYENQSPNPSTAVRTATFTVTDGDGGSSTPVARNINVISVNDAPVLSGANDLATINEDAFNNGGTLVSDLISGFVTDTGVGALEGIAVVAVDDTNGSWQFTTDNGANWTAFGPVPANAATLLAADTDTRVRFVPDPGWNGTVSNGITFHAWDQSLGVNGDTVDLTLVANVSDQFNAVSYANDDGSAVWTSNWTESNDDAAAATGNVRIESGKLHLDNLDGGTAESITRSADLSSAATATLTFDYDGYGAGGLDTIAFEVSNDGGSNWTLLESVNVVGNISDSKSYTLESFTALTDDMQIRIRIVQGFDGASEHINIDNVDIAYAGPGIDGSGAVSLATASSSISVTSVNNAPTMTEWYNEDWSTRKLLTINTAQVAGDVTDFPMLITFNTDAELAAQALANGDDIIFTAGDGSTLLAHEIEFFDETTGELRAWVKTDLSASVDTDIYIYFGNASATNQENAAGVWSSNYTAVYHLDEAPDGTAGDIVDSSGSNNHGSSAGGMDGTDLVNSAVGQGLAFDGANDMIRIPDSASLDGMNDAATFSLWINWVDAANGDHQIIMTSENRYSGGDGYEWASQGDGDHFFYPDATSPDGNYNIGSNPFTNNNWHHLAVTMDYTSKDVNIYVDGNEMSFFYEGVPSRWTDLSASGDLLFGGNPDRATRYFEGMMDEIRLADVVRSQDWILTEANNQTNPGAFLSVSSSESVLTRDTLTDINEDDFNSPGDSVLSIINSSGADRIMDDDDGAVEGIAVVAVDDTNGQWQYDANADGSWVAFGSVSDSNAVLLDTSALIRFVPNADYNGTAGDLTFRAWDQTSDVNGNIGIDVSTNGGSSAYSSETFGATLNVLPVADTPSFGGDETGSIQEDVAVVANQISTSGTLTIADPDTGESSFQAATINGTYGDLSIDTAGNWSYTADNTQAAIQQLDVTESLTDTLTVTSFDGTSHNVVVTINGSEDAAVISGTTTGSVTEDGTLTSSGTLTISDTDTNDNPSFADVAVTAGGNGYGNFEMTSGTWTYTLNNAHPDVQALDVTESITDSYTFTATDGSTQTVTVTINGAEDGSVIGGTATGTVAEDGTLTASDMLTITDVDSNDNPVTFNDVTSTASTYGSFQMSGNTWTYTLDNANATVQALDVTESITDSYTFTATDGSTQTVTVTINGAEDGSVIGGTATGTVAEDGTLTASNTLTITDVDSNDNPVSFNDVASTASTYGNFEMTGNTWTYTLDNANAAVQALDVTESITDSYTFTATDGSTQTVTVTINGAEDGSVIGGTATGTVAEDGTLTASNTLTITDVDSNDNPVSFNDVASTASTYGDFEMSGNTWTYTLDNANATVQALDITQSLTDSYTFTATDGSTQTVTVTINGAEDGSVIGGTATGTVAEDGTLTASNTLTITDVDSNDNPVNFNDVASTASTYGSFEMTGNTWTYTLDNANATVQALDVTESITDSYTFTATDGSTQTVTVTINGAEDGSVIGGTATGTVAEDGTLTASDTLTITDVDSNDNPVTFNDLASTASTYGSFEMTGNTWTYTLDNANATVQALDVTESITDSYTFTATDGSTQTVTVTINGAEDGSVIGGTATGTVAEDGTLTSSGALTISDVDSNDNPVSFNDVASTASTYGSFEMSGNTWTYTLDNANATVQALDITESITDSYTFTATDGSTQTVTVTINGAEDGSVIGGTAIGTIAEDGTLTASNTLTITDVDSNDNPVSFNDVTSTASTYGSFEMTGNTWTYTLDNANATVQALDVTESITDSYTFTSTDGSTQTVTVTINGAEDGSVIGGTATGTVAEDGTLTASNTLTITDVDSNDNPVSFNDVASTASTYGSFQMTGNTWTYTLDNANATVQALDVTESITDSYTFTATDGSTQTVTVTINGAEDGSVIGGTATGTVAEDGTLTASDTLTITDVDSNDNPVTFNDLASTASTYGSFEMTGNTWTYTLDNANATVQALDITESITDSYTFTATDGSTQTVTVTINGAEDGSVIGGTATGTVAEDGTLTASDTLTVTDVDSNDNPVSFNDVASTTSTYGNFEMTGNTWTYTLDNTNTTVQALDVTESITDSYTFTATDGSTQTVTVTINGAEDGSVIGGMATGTVAEDGTLTASDTLTITDVDSNDNPVSFNDVASTASTYGNFEMTGNTWTYTLDNANATVQALDVTESITDSYTFTATDGSTQTVTVTINGAEDGSVIGGTATGTVAEDGTLTATDTLTITDVDSNDNPVSFNDVASTASTYGSFEMTGNTWTYTLDNANATVQALDVTESITDSYTFTATDGSTQTVTVTINGAEDGSVIGGTATGTVAEDGTLTASNTLTITDVDSNDNPVSFNDVTSTASTYGSFEMAGNTWTYTLDNANAAVQALDVTESITDSYTFTATDGSTQTVTVTINGAEDGSVIGGTAIGTIAEDGTLTASNTLTITDVDSNDNPVSFNDVTSTASTYGSFEMTGNTWTYTLDNANATVQALDVTESITDSYTFTATDGSTQTVTVTINGAEDGSIIGGTATGAVSEDGTLTASDTLTITDVDFNDNPVSFNDVASTASTYGNFQMTGNTWTYTLDNANATVQALDVTESITDSYTFTATDGSTQTVTVTINGAEDGSIISGTATGAVSEDGTLTALDTLTITDVDSNDNPVNFNNVASTASTYGSFEMTGNTWTYTLDNTNATVQALDVTESITDSYTFAATDGSTQTVTVTINGAEDGSLIGGTAIGTVAEDGTLTASDTLTITDVDSNDNPVSFNDVASTASTYGSFEISGNTWTYTLDNANATVQALDVTESITDSYTFTATDGSTQTVTVTINGAEDGSVIGGMATGTVAEDGTLTSSGALTISDVDSNDNPVSFNDVTSTASTYGSFEMTGSTWTYTLDNANATVQALDITESITDSYTFTATDGSTQTVTVIINGAEDGSVIGGTATGTVAEDGTLTASDTLTITDVDSNDNPVSFNDVASTASTYGSFEISGNTWTYTLDNANATVQALDVTESITDSYTFTATDGSTQTVTVTINGAEDTPVFDSTAVTSATEDTAYSYSIVTSDVDIEAVVITAPTLPTWLTLTDNGDGTATLSGTPTNAQVGDHSVVLNVNDGEVNSNQSFTITVSNTNDAPVNTVPGAQTVNEDTAFNITGISVNDVDGNLATTQLTVSSGNLNVSLAGGAAISAGANGSNTLTLSGSQAQINAALASLSYQGNSHFHGSDTLSVLSTDSDGSPLSDSDDVAITVNPLADAGTFGGDLSATTNEDTATAGTVTFADTADGFSTNNFVLNTAATNGTAAIDSDGNWTYTPDANYNGTDSFIVEVTDDDGNVETQTINITVNPVVDAGTFGGDLSATTNEDTATAGTVTFADTADGFSTNNFVLNTAATNGTAAIDSDGNWTYTPDANYNGTDSFIVEVTDDDGNVETQTININVSQVDDTGTFGGDLSAITNEDTATAGTVTFADTADGFSTNNFVLNTAATNGTAAIDSDGNWTYTPDANYNGTDSFIVEITDDDGNVETRTISITVNPVNDAAVITGTDSGSVSEDVDPDLDNLLESSGNLIVTDTDSGESMFQAGTVNGIYGDLVIDSSGNWSYSADNSQPAIQQLDVTEILTETLTVTSFDGTTHEVVITIQGAEDAPVLGGTTTGSVNEDAILSASSTLTISDTDSNDNPVSFIDESATSGVNGYGTFEISSNTWIYTLDNTHASIQALDTSESLTDSHTFTATDGSTQTVTVTINGSEDAAVIGGIATGTVSEDGTFTASNTLTISDIDSNDNPVSFIDQASTPGANGYGNFEMSSGSWSYTLNNNHIVVQALDVGESMTDSFTFSATDGSTQTVTVTINGDEDTAVISGITTGTVTEDGTLTATDILTISDVDSNDNPVSFNDITATPGTGGYGSFELSANSWTYTLNNSHAAVQALDVGESLTDSYTFTATDGSTQTVTVTINGEEDTAVIGGTASGTVTEDGMLMVSKVLTISDVDSSDNPVSFNDVATTIGDNGYGTFGMSDNTWVYNLNNSSATIQSLDTGEAVTDTFTFTANDGSTRQVSVTIMGTEDNPVFDSAAVTAATEDSAYSYNIITSDVDIENVTITAPTLPAWLTLVDHGDGTAMLSGTPTNAEVGNHSVVITVDDGEVNTSQSFTIAVSNTNDAPVALQDSAITLEDISLDKIDVLTNDIDIDGDSLSVTNASAQFGNISINTDGTLHYTPDTNFNGTDIINYTISDGMGGTTTGILTMTVQAVNDNPFASTDSAITSEDVSLNNIQVLANDTDIDGDTLSVSDASAHNGTVFINTDNTLNYTPDADFNGNDTILYIVSDTNGGASTGVLNLTVSAVEDTIDETIVTDEDTPAKFNVMANDSFGENAVLDSVSAATNGSVTFTENGEVFYTPSPDFNGFDSFIYTVTTAAGNSESGTVGITVNKVVDTTEDTITTYANTSNTVDVLSNDSFATTAVVTDITQGSNGSVVIESDGRLRYQPDRNFIGTDSFIYTVTAASGEKETSTVHILVLAAPDDSEVINTPVEEQPTPENNTPKIEIPFVQASDETTKAGIPAGATDTGIEAADNNIPIIRNPIENLQDPGQHQQSDTTDTKEITHKESGKFKHTEFTQQQKLQEEIRLQALRDQLSNQTSLGLYSDFEDEIDEIEENRLFKHIDEMHEQMDRDFEGDPEDKVEAQVVLGSTATLTAGFVSWILRGGSLLASLMSTIPVLNRFDPLPIIKSRADKKKDKIESDETNSSERSEQSLKDKAEQIFSKKE